MMCIQLNTGSKLTSIQYIYVHNYVVNLLPVFKLNANELYRLTIIIVSLLGFIA